MVHVVCLLLDGAVLTRRGFSAWGQGGWVAGAKRREDLESQSLEVKFDSHHQVSIKVLLAVDPVYLLTPDEAGW